MEGENRTRDLYTQVVKANIYRSGAELVRRGSVELAEGAQTLTVHGLSASSLADSARIFCQEGISCSDLRFVDRFFGKEPPEAAEINRKIAALEKHIEVRELQIGMWKDNGNFSGRTQQAASEVQEYIEKLAERLEGLNADIIESRTKIEELQRELREVQRKASMPVLEAEVVAPAAGSYTFELRYFENSASWRPLHEIRTDGEGPLAIRMRANISQSTGEDWKGTEISLFSGSPNSAGTLPQIQPEYLDIRQSAPAFGRRAPGAANTMMMKAMADDTVCMDESAEAPMLAMGMMSQAAAAVDQGETSTEYKLPGKRDVLKGGEGTVADVQVLSVPAEYRIAAVPSQDPSAYLVAVVKPADLPLGSAVEAAVYYKNSYAGRIWLDPEYEKDETEITLGREERVFVGHKELRRKTSTTLLKGQKVVEYSFETSLRNETGKDIEMLVRDRVPVSSNKEIEVDVLETSGAERIAESGLLTWRIKLSAGESRTLNTAYKVSRPKDKEIVKRY